MQDQSAMLDDPKLYIWVFYRPFHSTDWLPRHTWYMTIYMQMCRYMLACVHIYIYLYMCLHIYLYMCLYIYLYMCLYIYTWTVVITTTMTHRGKQFSISSPSCRNRTPDLLTRGDGWMGRASVSCLKDRGIWTSQLRTLVESNQFYF